MVYELNNWKFQIGKVIKDSDFKIGSTNDSHN